MAQNKPKSEIAVIGLGKFGQAVALTLVQRGWTVLGIDADMRIVQDLADEIPQALTLDSTDEDALRQVDIGLYDTVVVALDSAFETKILTTLALKNLGVRRVICTAASLSERTVLLKIGADQVVMPENDAGKQLALTLSFPTILQQLPLGMENSVSSVKVPPSFIGRTVRETDVRQAFGLSLLAIRRENQVLVSPSSETTYTADDQLVVLGKNADVERFGQAQ